MSGMAKEKKGKQQHQVQFSSVTQSCLTLCNPMESSMPGFPVLYQLPELAQTHFHLIGGAIQSSHPLLSPSLAFNLFQHQGLLNESVLHIKWPKYWSFTFSISPSDEYSGLISSTVDWFDFLAVQRTLKSLLQHTVQKHQFFGGAQPYLWSNSHSRTQLLEKL